MRLSIAYGCQSRSLGRRHKHRERCPTHGKPAHTAQLEQKGYKVVGSRWGNGLFDMAVCEQPDLRIVDPGECPNAALSFALRRLARDPLTHYIPIVVDPPCGGEFYRRIETVVGLAPASKSPKRQV